MGEDTMKVIIRLLIDDEYLPEITVASEQGTLLLAEDNTVYYWDAEWNKFGTAELLTVENIPTTDKENHEAI